MLAVRRVARGLIALALTACAGSEPRLPPGDPLARIEPKHVRFGVTGADGSLDASLVPDRARLEPYDWDRVPNSASSIQVVRACRFYTQVLGLEPVTPERWWCWDESRAELMTLAGVEGLGAVAARHPDWVWIVGNEMDQPGQDGLSPRQYAEFFGFLARTIAAAVRVADPGARPRLVFCQVSSARRTDWCEAAYREYQGLVAAGRWSDWPADLEPSDAIHAISAHGYAHTDESCPVEGTRCFGSSLDEARLGRALLEWRSSLNQFAAWSNSTDGGALAEKPLWLTEFGALWAFCHRPSELRPRVDHRGGVACPDRSRRRNGDPTDDHPFYGRNDREGLWGVQRGQLLYLLNPNGNPTGNQGDWQAAWWFTSVMGDWDGSGECLLTGWLLGEDGDCRQGRQLLSRAGVTYRDTLECLLFGESCPVLLWPGK